MSPTHDSGADSPKTIPPLIEENGATEGGDENFQWWDRYWGMLVDDSDPDFRSRLFGFETVSPENKHRYRGGADYSVFEFPTEGAVFGYIAEGSAVVSTNDEAAPFTCKLAAGQYFCLPNGGHISLGAESRVIAMQRVGWRSLLNLGGPIEEKGRLKYIDSCSDSLLISPLVKGDPCLNHLHFPKGIDQTHHTHPSTRFGIVARGLGSCMTPFGRCRLPVGRIFWIPKDGIHGFQTLEGESMDVVPYHPDTDFGPEHEEHPMVNRTLVDGDKIDNSTGVHATAEVVDGYFKVA